MTIFWCFPRNPSIFLIEEKNAAYTLLCLGTSKGTMCLICLLTVGDTFLYNIFKKYLKCECDQFEESKINVIDKFKYTAKVQIVQMVLQSLFL